MGPPVHGAPGWFAEMDRGRVGTIGQAITMVQGERVQQGPGWWPGRQEGSVWGLFLRQSLWDLLLVAGVVPEARMCLQNRNLSSSLVPGPGPL